MTWQKDTVSQSFSKKVTIWNTEKLKRQKSPKEKLKNPIINHNTPIITSSYKRQKKTTPHFSLREKNHSFYLQNFQSQ